MNKKIFYFSFLIIAICGVVFKVTDINETEIDKLRKQHAEFLQNHPFQKTGELLKKKRKSQGLPPNAYFEQKYLSEINPNTGRTHKENVYQLQEELNKRLTSLATKTGRSKSFYIKQALMRYLEDMEDTYLAIDRIENPGERVSMEDAKRILDVED